MIPMLGIQSQFKRQPEGDGERHFSEQILDDLTHEALQHADRLAMIGLYVHPDNAPAIRFYKRSGFTDFDKTWTDPDTGVKYPSMLLDLCQFAPNAQ